MEVLNQNSIIKYLKSHKKDFLQKYSIYKIGIFGSFANNKNTKHSDIDIVYETSLKDLTFLQTFQLEDELKNQFQREIDLVNFKYMNPIIKRKAIKDIIYV
jgi:predicted nucleotidyltransferase